MIAGFWAARLKPTNPVTQITPVTSESEASAVVNRGLPTRLKIPKLKIDAAVAYMGLTQAGDMDTPSSTTDVGWYKYGPLPGNPGSAVMSGHIDGPRGEPAVFSQLSKLQVGDQFSVSDSTGQSTGFTVHDIKTYQQDQRPPEVFSSSQGAHLNLITCVGEWDRVQRQFTERLVVFSEKSP